MALERNIRPATVAWLEAQLMDLAQTRAAWQADPAPGTDDPYQRKQVFQRMQQVLVAMDATLADLPEQVAAWVRLRYMSNPRPTAEAAAAQAGLSWRKAKRWRWVVLRSLADRLGEW